ncbi:MAG: putative dsRNA-binding protein [Bacillota bacterium]
MATRELEPAMSIDPGAGDSRNYKAILQEIFQKKEKYIPGYQVVGETGPDHDKTFEVEVSSASGTIGRGTGKTKKEAEQAAAKDALSRMGVWAPHEATAFQGGEARGRQATTGAKGKANSAPANGLARTWT